MKMWLGNFQNILKKTKKCTYCQKVIHIYVSTFFEEISLISFADMMSMSLNLITFLPLTVCCTVTTPPFDQWKRKWPESAIYDGFSPPDKYSNQASALSKKEYRDREFLPIRSLSLLLIINVSASHNLHLTRFPIHCRWLFVLKFITYYYIFR